MFLQYENKKNENNILKKAGTFEAFSLDEKQSTLIKGDNFIALSKLLKQYKSKIDLIYIDPPYNTNRVFTVSEGRSSTISNASNGDVAYSDNLKKEEYIEFLRERLILLRELLSEEGSIYLHIDSKMGHYVKIIMDEVFGEENFKNDISRIKSNPKNFGRKAYGNYKDVILFYSKNHKKNIFNNIKTPLTEEEIEKRFEKVDELGRYTTVPIHAPGETQNGATGKEWNGIMPPEGRHWRYHPDKLTELNEAGLIEWSSTGNPRLKNYADGHKGKKMQDIWEYKDPSNPLYPTEKNKKMLKMIIQQSSKKSSIILDCFAGSGSTLLAAQELNRKWIGIDSSEVAIKTISKRFHDVRYNYIEIDKEDIISQSENQPQAEQLELALQ